MEIGIWGDSITYGAGDSEALGWVGRLRKSLISDDYTNVYNRGVCGDTTEDLLKRFVIEADSIEPNIVVFAIGINDSKYPPQTQTNKVALDQFKENMQLLIRQAQKHTKQFFIVGATKVDEEIISKWDSSTPRFINNEIKSYNAVLKEVAEVNQCPFVNVFDVLNEKTDLDDGLHPNAVGYEKMCAAIGPFIKFGVEK